MNQIASVFSEMAQSYPFSLELYDEVEASDSWQGREMKAKYVKTQLRALERSLEVFFPVSSR